MLEKLKPILRPPIFVCFNYLHARKCLGIVQIGQFDAFELCPELRYRQGFDHMNFREAIIVKWL